MKNYQEIKRQKQAFKRFCVVVSLVWLLTLAYGILK